PHRPGGATTRSKGCCGCPASYAVVGHGPGRPGDGPPSVRPNTSTNRSGPGPGRAVPPHHPATDVPRNRPLLGKHGPSARSPRRECRGGQGPAASRGGEEVNAAVPEGAGPPA